MVNWKTKPSFKRVIFFTGAGLSKESGLDTYHDSEGVWTKYDLTQVCNYLTFKRNRELAFEFFKSVQDKMNVVQPNEAHQLIGQLMATYAPGQVVHLTQNVDLMMEKVFREHDYASYVSHYYVKLHGSIDTLQCMACGNKWQGEYAIDARCPKCASLKGVKPGVVLYNETAPEYRKIHQLRTTLDDSKDLIVFIGTQFEIWRPEDILPKLFNSQSVINVNPQHKEHSRIGTHLNMTAVEAVAILHNTINAWLGTSHTN